MNAESWSEALDDARALLARMTLPELIDLVHMVADDLILRTMERAGESEEDEVF